MSTQQTFLCKSQPFATRRYSPHRCGLGLLFIGLWLALTGCGERQHAATSAPASAERNYPSPPPPSTSATQILSGGWLVAGDGSEPQFDQIVVLRGGAVVAVGKRGDVDVPADSIGVDASGKWILPGPADLLAAQFSQRNHSDPAKFTNLEFRAIVAGRNADLVLLNRNPLVDPEALSDVHALVVGGEVKLIEDQAN